LTVEPSTGLVDGQVVRVTGTGYPAGSPFVEVGQCGSVPADGGDCDLAGGGSADLSADGSFEFEMPVYALFDTADAGTVDCREPDRCVLVAAAGDARVVVPVAFDPQAALLSPPMLTVNPATDLVDGQLVQVEGRGFRPQSYFLQVYECGPVPSPSICQVIEEGVAVAPDGTLSTGIRVAATLTTEAGEIDCRANDEPCLLVASEGTPGSRWAGEAELAFDDDPAPAPEPEIVVTPMTGLHDFNTLSVQGNHFRSVNVSVQVCQAEESGPCDQDNAERPTPDAADRFELEITGWATFTDPASGDSVDCRQPPGCVVVATDEDRGTSARVSLAFGPPDPPRGRYFDPVFDDVEVERDLVYRKTVDHQGAPVQLTLDIYRPAGDTTTRRPAVIWMHGGWFTSGDKDNMADYAREFARRGYVGISLEYRLRPGMDQQDRSELYEAMVDAYEDSAAGVDWLRAHAREYGIDRHAIVAGGWSAGAVIATNLAYFPGQVGAARSRIAAALPIAGWFARPDDLALSALPGPLALPDRGEPPAVVFHGTADHILPVGSPRDLCPLAEEAHIACQYVGYEGDGHLIVNNRQRDIVRRSIDFLAEQVLGPRGYIDIRCRHR
jgi:acetyl esterase/lipase